MQWVEMEFDPHRSGHVLFREHYFYPGHHSLWRPAEGTNEYRLNRAEHQVR